MHASAISTMKVLLFGCFVLGSTAGVASATEASGQEGTIIAIDDFNFGLAPYVWRCTGKGIAARAEATMPGAYLRVVFQRSTTAGLFVDGAANRGCPASSMPVVEYSIDEGPYQVVQLTKTDNDYTLPLASGLDHRVSHRLEIYFRAADLAQNRWRSSTAHLRIGGLRLDAGGTLLPRPPRPKKAIGFGDSITEGVGVDGLFTSWQSLGVNNARGTWFPIVCAALGCEYGQLGSGGQGMSRAIEMPPLPRTWDRYDANNSRLSGGLLVPEPDYVFCCMGTNDFLKNITSDYSRWLADMRKACAHARFFCVIPPLGFHEAEVREAVAARNKAGDARVFLIDTSPLRHAFRAGKGATQLGYDGVHPSMYGHAMLGALITSEAQKALGNGECPRLSTYIP